MRGSSKPRGCRQEGQKALAPTTESMLSKVQLAPIRMYFTTFEHAPAFDHPDPEHEEQDQTKLGPKRVG
jgi:hypothetical protein